MRRAGANPTDIEVMEIMNKIDDESGSFDFPVSIISFFLHFYSEPGGVLLPDDTRCQGGRRAGAEGNVQGLQQRQLRLCSSRGDQVDKSINKYLKSLIIFHFKDSC